MSEKFFKAINEAGTGARIPVMDLIKSDPQTAALISKLVIPLNPIDRDSKGNLNSTARNLGALSSVGDKVSQNISESETVRELHTEIDLAELILVSSILSPKDMVSCELTYVLKGKTLPPDVSSAITNALRNYFSETYKINNKLPEILKDMLFRTGSHVLAVIPENSLDEIINGIRVPTLESFKEVVHDSGIAKSIGLLGPAKLDNSKNNKYQHALEAFNTESNIISEKDSKITFALESNFNLKDDDHPIYVIDNFDVLKIHEMDQIIRRNKINDKINKRSKLKKNFSFESYSFNTNDGKPNYSDTALINKLYRNNIGNSRQVAEVKTQDQLTRRSVGSPLVMKLPSRSVIPVFVPGSPENHLGVFVLLDQKGYPLAQDDAGNYYGNVGSKLNAQSTGNDFASSLNARVKTQLDGSEKSPKEFIDMITREYEIMVEKDLLGRFKNGVGGSDVRLGKNQEAYRIMLSRALQKQNTQILFIPEKLVTYFAFDYSKEGTGKSLLDDMRVLNGLRSTLTIANIMTSVRNSIGQTNVKFKLDPEDPNPTGSIEKGMDEISRTRQNFPLRTSAANEIVGWVGRAGFVYSFEGHPGLPDMSIDFEERSSSYAKPDTEQEEDLRKRAVAKFGLTPDQIDAGYQAEFAKGLAQSNILFTKRIMMYQEMFAPMISNHCRQIAVNSDSLITEIRNILLKNIKVIAQSLNIEEKRLIRDTAKANNSKMIDVLVDGLLDEVICNFHTSLPKPNTVTLEALSDAFDVQSKALDNALDYILSSKFFTDSVGGDISSQVDNVREVVKAHYMRQWMAENGYMVELNELTTADSENDGFSIYDINQRHIANLTKNLSKFISGLVPIIDAANKVTDSAGNSLGEGGTTDTSSSDSGDSSDDDIFGDIDFGDSADTEETANNDTAPNEEKEVKDNTANKADDDIGLNSDVVE